jgi:hypothetical protein
MAKDILKEAIADAKAVREVALANAKAALEEAFTPRLQSMLSAKLSEELNEDEELEENKEEIDEMYEDDPRADKEMDETYMEGEKEDLDEEIDLEEILNELELEEGEAEDTVDEAKEDGDDKVEEAKDKDLDEAKDKDEETMDEAKDDEDTVDEAKDDKEEKSVEEMHMPHYQADDVQKVTHKADYVHEDKEFNLDALLEEINNLDENEDDLDEVTRNTSLGGNTADDKETHDWYSQQYQEGETNEVLGTAAAGVAGLVAAAGGLSALEVAAEDPEWRAKYPKVAKALAMLQDMGAAAGNAMRSEAAAKDKELEETKAALETVKAELNEVNLLNSKLLYVNRIFKANNLDEAQKLRVVETLDNAENIKEAKLIYETIKDTFNVANTKKGSVKTKTKSLKEGIGMASKAAGTSTAPKKEVISESNNMVSRFQKLANIKINQ